MLSSSQIASMHTGQQQMFGAQQAYSQQLSSQVPQPYGSGLGATGFGGGGTFGGGGGFNYGGGGYSGYGPGSSFGQTMTSGIGGVGRAVGGGMGMAGGLAGAFLGRGGGMMGMLSGGMMGMGIGGVVGAGVKMFADSFVEGAQQQSAIDRTLSQFQFQNASSRTGRGFSRQDSMQIGNMVRQMERLPDMLTSFGELNKIMDKMGQMGLMHNVRDAGEFQRKFRDTVGTIQSMAKMMGTTMDSALQMFSQSRLSGFYSKGDILRNTIAAQVTSNLTGMTATQVSATQQYGGALGHATGGSRRTGAAGITRITAQLGMANQMGILSNEQIVEMTGKEGAAGIQDLAGDMSQLGYKMGRSNVGRAMTLALGEVEDGRYTGKMDQALVDRVRSGDLGLSELKRLALSKSKGRGAKLSYAAHKSRLNSEMAGQVGAEGMGMQLQSLLGDRGWTNPDAINLVMQKFKASEEEANLLQKLMPNLSNIGSQIQSQAKQQARNQAIQSVVNENSWDAIKHRAVTKLKHHTTDIAVDLGKNVSGYFQKFVDDTIDGITGRYSVEITKRTKDIFSAARSGDAGAKNYLNNALSTMSRSNNNVKLLDNSSGVRNLIRGFSSTSNSDDSTLALMEAGPSSLRNQLTRRRVGPNVYDNMNTIMTYTMAGTIGGALVSAPAGGILAPVGGAIGLGAGVASAAYNTFNNAGEVVTTTEKGLKGAGDYFANMSTSGAGLNSTLKKALPWEQYRSLTQDYARLLDSNKLEGKGDQEKLTIALDTLKKNKYWTQASSKFANIDDIQVATSVMSDSRFAGLASAPDLVNISNELSGRGKKIDASIESDNVTKQRGILAKKLTGTNNTASWAEMEKDIDSATPMGRLLTGSIGKKNGLATLQDDELRKMLDLETWGTEQMNFAKAAGLSSEEAFALSQDLALRQKYKKAFFTAGGERNSGVTNAVESIVGSKDNLSIGASINEFKSRGFAISQENALGGKNQTAISDLTTAVGKRGKKTKFNVKDFINKAGEVGTNYSKGDWQAGDASLTGLTDMYAGIDDAATRKLVATYLKSTGQNDLWAQGERAWESGSRDRKMKKSKSGEMSLKSLGIKKGDVGDDTYAKIVDIAKGDKIDTVNRMELNAINALLSPPKGLDPTIGKSTESTKVSEEKVAELLKGMQANQDKTHQAFTALLGKLTPGA